MKTIKAISIWDNGKTQQATVLNAYAVNVTLNTSATFWYGLLTETETGLGSMLAQGNIIMDGEAYQSWTEDDIAWDFIASNLNLEITGEYIPPVIEQPVIEEAPVVDPIVEEETVLPDSE